MYELVGAAMEVYNELGFGMAVGNSSDTEAKNNGT